MLGFVFIGTALASPSGLNPTIEEILDATTHTELHAHSHNGPESNLSNAQRFAGGLPPARPASFQRGRSNQGHVHHVMECYPNTPNTVHMHFAYTVEHMSD